MKIGKLVATIDVDKHDFSLLLVDPNPRMLEWLRLFFERNGLQKYRLYYPEGNLALVIPKVDRFGAQTTLDEFITCLKPGLLKMELRRFQAKPEDLGYPMTAETFDMFFTIAIREAVNLMSDLNLTLLTT